MTAAFGAPGLFELLCIGFICLAPVVLVAVAVLVAVRISRRAGPPPGYVVCPGCGAQVPAERSCRECGCPLESEPPSEP